MENQAPGFFFRRLKRKVDDTVVCYAAIAASTQDMPCVGPHKGRERQMLFGGRKVLAVQIMAGQPIPPNVTSPEIWPY